jgi:predicted nuclease of restriction endonuclease-like (RecB) superfamily
MMANAQANNTKNTFEHLVDAIYKTHRVLQQSMAKAVDIHLTARNWLIGYYIFEYEQSGEDRATYGKKLLASIAQELQDKKLSNTNERELRRYRQFYKVYQSFAAIFSKGVPGLEIRGALSPEFNMPVIRGAASPESKDDLIEKLIYKLSFSHLAELASIPEHVKRSFYETECIKANWSIRELKRQMDSLYFERSSMSRKPEKLTGNMTEVAEKLRPEDIVKSVYTFEFLGLQPKDVVEENDLETALLDHLQEFILEMGHGFCFEARQRKIMIGDEYYFIDLVFYHRILKCHVLIELKIDKFSHSHAGQLNTYLSFYKKEVMQPDDNPPVGILLVTNKNETLVEYALAGMNNNFFVSRYMIELPSKEKLEQFIKYELTKL